MTFRPRQLLRVYIALYALAVLIPLASIIETLLGLFSPEVGLWIAVAGFLVVAVWRRIAAKFVRAKKESV
jgi:putative Ca2+/H+ antiporter (TMEM165/GDT1 family)